MHVYRKSEVIHRLQQNQPESAQDVLDDCELPLLYIGGGAFRDVYFVVGTDLVIKIPRRTWRKKITEKRIQHARDEYAIWKRIKRSKRKFLQFQKYMPEILYFNPRTGLLVMRKYEKVTFQEVASLIQTLEGGITRVMKAEEADIHHGNLGKDTNGNFKIIDMGLFIQGKV